MCFKTKEITAKFTYVDSQGKTHGPVTLRTSNEPLFLKSEIVCVFTQEIYFKEQRNIVSKLVFLSTLSGALLLCSLFIFDIQKKKELKVFFVCVWVTL